MELAVFVDATRQHALLAIETNTFFRMHLRRSKRLLLLWPFWACHLFFTIALFDFVAKDLEFAAQPRVFEPVFRNAPAHNSAVIVVLHVLQISLKQQKLFKSEMAIARHVKMIQGQERLAEVRRMVPILHTKHFSIELSTFDPQAVTELNELVQCHKTCVVRVHHIKHAALPPELEIAKATTQQKPKVGKLYVPRARKQRTLRRFTVHHPMIQQPRDIHPARFRSGMPPSCRHGSSVVCPIVM
mmetsp:Transcript_36815/g.54001  ORF Transcript_36815/g.54001 Transcript_36815/m.54001 type:complete len:243 (+) Transcript_36815:1095-1823(+)